MKDTEIIIIGAGAAGLMAGYTLSKTGKWVTILEARDRIGGRIHTLKNSSFFHHAELGAEFVHGNLPVTQQLVKDAGLEYVSVEGEMWQCRKGKFSKGFEQMDWGLLLGKLAKLEKDITIGAFLDEHFPGEKYNSLRESVARFVSGYDTADPYLASAFALREEWQSEDDDAQYRIAGGYGKLMDHLAIEIKANGSEIFLNSVAKYIEWENGKVKVALSGGEQYSAGKLIIALPLGVLRSGAITFSPGVRSHKNALEQIGFGAIIKILLEFKEAFWESDRVSKIAGNSLSHMGFVLSDEPIPTWWTQFPTHSTVLTGWLGGPPAEKQKYLTSEELLELALQSLSNIFKIEVSVLKDSLVAREVVNWTVDPFTLGSYAYDTVESHKARKILANPIDDTIYFAGEYLYEGPAMGTVEAALTSGKKVAMELLG